MTEVQAQVETPSRFSPPGGLYRSIVTCLTLLGLVGSGFMTYEALAKGAPLPGCGPGSGCEAVLNSAWSRWLGIPVAAPAMVIYAALLGAALHLGAGRPKQNQRYAWAILLAGTAGVALSAVWFTVVQWVLIQSFCKYCLTVHSVGVVLTVVVWFRAPLGRSRLMPGDPADPMLFGGPWTAAFWVFGVVTAGVLAGGQLLFPPSEVQVQQVENAVDFDTGPSEGMDREMSLLGGRVRLKPAQYPMLGSIDAKVLVVYLFDYTCPHCRRLHGQLEQAIEHYQGALGVVALPTPLDADCNPMLEETDPPHETACELAQLALAVWQVDREAFGVFDRWLFELEVPPGVAEARAKAVELVGAETLEAALADADLQEQLPRNAMLYHLAGGRALPQLIIGGSVIRGRPPTAEELFTLLEDATVLEGE